MGTIPEPGGALLDRLAAAVNSHDLDALEAASPPATATRPRPTRPGASPGAARYAATGSRSSPSCPTSPPGCCDGEVIWSEWEMTGTRRDGTAHQMAGVIVFGVRGGHFT